MKKSILATLALSLGLVGCTIATTSSADAATWHKGTPSFLVGKKYRTKKLNAGWGHWGREKISATKTSFKVIWLQNSGTFHNARYTKHGKYYYVKSHEGLTLKIRRINSSKIFAYNGSNWHYMYRY